MVEEFVPDSARLIAEATIKREGLLNKSWSYDYGVVWRGMEMLFAATGEEKYRAYILDALDSLVDAAGNAPLYRLEEQNLDHLCIGRQFIWAWRQTGKEKYRLAARTLRSQLDTQPRTSDGGFWHKNIYPYQMWLDGQHMAVPFYIQYETALGGGDPCALADAARQLILAWEHTLNPESGLPCHGWDEKRAQIWADPVTGRAAHAWGRAVGWYMVALIDSLEMLPEDVPERQTVLSIFRKLSRKMLAERRQGVWLQVLDCPERLGNYPESSGSCLICYALLKGARLGLLPPAAGAEAREAFRAIQRHFLGRMKNGAYFVAKCCQGAGLGGAANRDGSYDYYMSENVISYDLKATGAFIQAACEYDLQT